MKDKKIKDIEGIIKNTDVKCKISFGVSVGAAGLTLALLAVGVPAAAPVIAGLFTGIGVGYSLASNLHEVSLSDAGYKMRNDELAELEERGREVDKDLKDLNFNADEYLKTEDYSLKEKFINEGTVEKWTFLKEKQITLLMKYFNTAKALAQYLKKSSKKGALAEANEGLKVLEGENSFIEKVKKQLETDKQVLKTLRNLQQEDFMTRLKNIDDFVELKEIGDELVEFFGSHNVEESDEIFAKMKELQEKYSHCVIKLNNKEEYIKAYTDFAEEKIKMLRLLELHSLGDAETLLSIEKSIDKMEENIDLVKSGEVLTFSYLHNTLKQQKGESEEKELIDISFVQEFAKMWSSNKNVENFCQKYLDAVKVLEKIDSKYDYSVVNGCNRRDRYMAHVVLDGEVDKHDLELYESIKSVLSNNEKETNEEETDME